MEKNTNNRNINQHIVRQYANSMQRGDWELSNDAICFDKSGKLTNGQHRLRAIILSKRSYEFLVARNMEEKSYLAMDRGRLRSIGAQLSIMGVANSNRISSGISTYIFLHSTYKHKKNCDNVERTAHRILDIYNSYKEDIEILIRWSQNVYAKSKVIPNSIILGLSLFLIKDGDISDNIVRYFFDSISSLDSCDDNFLNSVRKYLLTQSKKIAETRKVYGMISYYSTTMLNFLSYCFLCYMGMKGYKRKINLYNENNDYIVELRSIIDTNTLITPEII